MVLSQPPEIIFPPSDLLSDEPPVETERHLWQIFILLASLKWWWRDRFTDPAQQRKDYFAAGNLTIYYSTRQRRSEDLRGPDFFVVLNTDYKERASWMVWAEEGKYPNLIVEILSKTTASTDRGLKKQLYQEVFRTPEYFWFDPFSLEFEGFRLCDGRAYEEIESSEQGWLWSQELELFLGIVGARLRFLTAEGMVVPTPEEAAQQEQRRANLAEGQVQHERQRMQWEQRRADLAEGQVQEEQRRANLAEQRAEALAQRLRELGMEP